MSTKRDYAEEITNKLIKLMEEGAGSFEMPWHRLSQAGGSPVNAVTGNPYNGINVLTLGLSQFEHSTNKWASFKQWQSRGRSVAKGETGSPIVFFKPIEVEARDGEKGDENGNKLIRMARFSCVFNESQLVDYEQEEAPELPNKVEALARVDAYVTATGAKIQNGGDRACYIPFRDEIRMPARNQFKDTATSSATEAYYSTLLHELTHWTGHKSRLDRLAIAKREDYAFEELIAELGAAFQCMRLGISTEPRADHAQYLESWLRALKSDKRHLFKAAAKAQAAVTMLESFQIEQSEAA